MGKAKADLEEVWPMKYILNERNLQDICKDSYSISEVIRKSGRRCTGGNHQTVKAKITTAKINKIIILILAISYIIWHNSTGFFK